MARKKKEVAATPPGPASEMPEFGDIPLDQLPDDVQGVFDQLGDDVTKVLLYRRTKGEKQAYVGTIDADDFDLDYIATTYGGGRYLARLVGQQGIIKGITFYIDEAIRPKRRDDEGGGVSGGLERLVERLIEAQRPQKDPMEIAAALAAASASQMQSMLTMIAPLLAQQRSGGDGMSAGDILKAVELGIDLGGKDEGYLPVIREVGVPMVRALEQLTSRRGAALPPAQPEGGAVAPTPQPPAAGVPQWVTMLKPHVAKVLDFAQRGADPGTVAAALDLQFPRLARWLEDAMASDPTFEEKLVGFFPEIAPHRSWLTQLLNEFAPEPPPTAASGVHEDDAEGDE